MLFRAIMDMSMFNFFGAGSANAQDGSPNGQFLSGKGMVGINGNHITLDRSYRAQARFIVNFSFKFQAFFQFNTFFKIITGGFKNQGFIIFSESFGG